MSLPVDECLLRPTLGSPRPELDGFKPAPGITPVVLEARKGAPAMPAVRIFLSTRPEHHRAERVFFYALQRVRNPDRRYEIYPIADLPISEKHGGFGNDRFAVPELAGRRGRALYNEVGQIYFADPADLFDLPMDGHGYLSPSPIDTEVMLIDCSRMAGCWSLDRVQRLGSQALQDLALAEPGSWGALDCRWHARDQGYRPGRTRLLHYANPSLQPWQPMPERYSYHFNPSAEVFHSLELAADREGYEVYSAASPSPGFLPACAREAGEPQTLPDGFVRGWLESGDRQLALALVGAWRQGDAGTPTATHWSLVQLRQENLPPQDVIAVNGLERLPPEDLPWLLDRLFRLGRRKVLVKATLGAKGSMIGTLEGWRALLRRIAQRYPDRSWQLDCPDCDSSPQRYRSDTSQRQKPPRVWVLQGQNAGDYAQLLDMAEGLGWPYEIKPHPTSIDALVPPWPDLILSAGRRTAPLACEIKQRAGEGTRSVLLGRPRMPLSRFDLVLNTPQHALPLNHSNVVALPAPFIVEHPLDERELELWRQRFAHLPRPWIAMLVGGSSLPYWLHPGSARALGREASSAARTRGGSLLVSTSPRTGSIATRALLDALEVPSWCYRFGSGEENPHRALLALADAFIVTCDSVAMLTEACLTGRPVALYPLPVHRHPLQFLQHKVEGLLGVFPSRNTPQPPGRLERLYDRLIEEGKITREPLFGEVHRTLGVAPLPEGLDLPPKLSPELLAASRERALQAIREVMAAERPVRT